MKIFNTNTEMKLWFNQRLLDDDISYIKTIDQRIIVASAGARQQLNIYDGELLDTSLIMSNVDEVAHIDKRLVDGQFSGVSYELWSLESPRMLYWNKRLIAVGKELFILQELHPSVDTSTRSIIGAITVNRAFNYAHVKEKFTEKERAIMYLLIHGLSVKQVAEVMFVSPGTVKGHLWDKIRIKFMNLGYDVVAKEQVIEVGCLVGMGNVMPSILISKIKTTSKLINKYSELIHITSSNELDLR